MPNDPCLVRLFPQPGDALLHYHRELAARLPETGKVLDLGCGDHRELARYRTARREIWGADLQVHPQVHEPAWFRPLTPDGGLPFPPATFDLVASCWVLEHVACPGHFLGEVRRVLRPGGRFVALTPNGRHYATWITRLFHCLPHAVTQEVVYRIYGRRHHDTFPTHFRLNTLGRLRRAAAAADLRLEEVLRIANQGYFSFWQPLHRAAMVADRVLDSFCPGLGELYMVAILRKPAADESRAVGSEKAA